MLGPVKNFRQIYHIFVTIDLWHSCHLGQIIAGKPCLKRWQAKARPQQQNHVSNPSLLPLELTEGWKKLTFDFYTIFIYHLLSHSWLMMKQQAPNNAICKHSTYSSTVEAWQVDLKKRIAKLREQIADKQTKHHLLLSVSYDAKNMGDRCVAKLSFQYDSLERTWISLQDVCALRHAYVCECSRFKNLVGLITGEKGNGIKPSNLGMMQQPYL